MILSNGYVAKAQVTCNIHLLLPYHLQSPSPPSLSCLQFTTLMDFFTIFCNLLFQHSTNFDYCFLWAICQQLASNMWNVKKSWKYPKPPILRMNGGYVINWSFLLQQCKVQTNQGSWFWSTNWWGRQHVGNSCFKFFFLPFYYLHFKLAFYFIQQSPFPLCPLLIVVHFNVHIVCFVDMSILCVSIIA